MITWGAIPDRSLPQYAWPARSIPGILGSVTVPIPVIPTAPAAHPQPGTLYTPKVAGIWYYLYLNPAGDFAVSANEPTFNTIFFAYYHPTAAQYRAVGKFYVG